MDLCNTTELLLTWGVQTYSTSAIRNSLSFLSEGKKNVSIHLITPSQIHGM